MENFEIREEKANLKEELKSLREMQLDYINLMHFLKDIRHSLNDAFENSNYTQEGLINTVNLIESQIDGYNYNSFEVLNLSSRIDGVNKRLEKNIELLNEFNQVS